MSHLSQAQPHAPKWVAQPAGIHTWRFPGPSPPQPCTLVLGQILQDVLFEFYQFLPHLYLWVALFFFFFFKKEQICHSGQPIQPLLLIEFILFTSGLLFIISLQFLLCNISHLFSLFFQIKDAEPSFSILVSTFLVCHKAIIPKARFFINMHKLILQSVEKGTWLQYT